KIKQGKQELYLKDDAALNDYLISSAVDHAELQYSPEAPAIQGPALEKLLHQYQDALDQVDRLAQRCDPDVWMAMLEHAPLEPTLWESQPALRQWLDALAMRLAHHGLGKAQFRF